jgi:hypothetical protein
LPPAYLIQINDLYRSRVMEVRGRIIEGQMPVDADTQADKIDGSLI